MLLLDPPLSFTEIMTHETLPLAVIFPEVLRFLQGREDAALFGAQAVNAWTAVPRMTADVDILAVGATELAEALRAHLADRLHLAARVREVVPGGFRIYQVRKPKNRHLVDIRHVDVLPRHEIVDGVRVLVPLELVAMKVMSIAARAGQPKGDTDRADLRRLLLAAPELRGHEGLVAARLEELGVTQEVLSLWTRLAAEPLEADPDESDPDESE